MQECTTLHCKNVHSCYIKVYTLIMQGATLNLKFIMLVDVNYNIQKFILINVHKELCFPWQR